MLRLTVGWSAARLSQEYETAGVGSLTRTTIAKIESDIRHIKAGEVEGVARVFGLTANDLLDPDGPSVFLCYAQRDEIIGQEVAAWMFGHGFRVLSAGLAAKDHDELAPDQRHVTGTAQAFVMLLSSDFLSSPTCRQHLDLAVRRQQWLLSAGLATHSIYVLRVAETPGFDGWGLEGYPVIDLAQASDSSREAALSKLGGSIILSARTTVVQANPPTHVRTRQMFLDRGEELERVF
jgi:hypothetical protein